MNYTKGERYIGCGDEYWYVSTKDNDQIIARFRHKGDALLDAVAINACIELNPNNPMAVAQSIKDMYEALKELLEVYNISEASSDLRDLPEYWQAAVKTLAKAEGK